MRTIDIAKNVWKHAFVVQDRIDKGELPQRSVLYHYFGILSLYAAGQAAYYSKDEEWLMQAKEMIAEYPGNFDSPKLRFRPNFANYRVGGLAKSWMCMKGYFDDDTYQLDELKKYADETLNSPKSHDGILCNPYCLEKELIWIDIVYAVAPFMLYAGIKFNDERYIDFAVDQTFKLYDVFLDESNGLLHQARGFMGDKTTISHDHWSRGNGWGYIGLTELLRYLPNDSKYYEEVKERYIAHSKAILKYQDYKGLWRQSMAEPFAWQESSGTGIILYGFGVGLRLGVLDKDEFMPAFEKGIKGLYKYCINNDFSIEKCCTSCLCPGDTPERKGTIEAYLVDTSVCRDDGHSFGPVILAMTEAYRNGIIDINEEE